jgi:hypothetical protein
LYSTTIQSEVIPLAPKDYTLSFGDSFSSAALSLGRIIPKQSPFVFAWAGLHRPAVASGEGCVAYLLDDLEIQETFAITYTTHLQLNTRKTLTTTIAQSSHLGTGILALQWHTLRSSRQTIIGQILTRRSHSVF